MKYKCSMQKLSFLWLHHYEYIFFNVSNNLFFYISIYNLSSNVQFVVQQRFQASSENFAFLMLHSNFKWNGDVVSIRNLKLQGGLMMQVAFSVRFITPKKKVLLLQKTIYGYSCNKIMIYSHQRLSVDEY